MRIAVSGTHAIGKSTLVEALAERLPGHTVVPEPYELLEDRGYEFAHPPSVEDYVAQLRQSLAVLRRPAPNLIAERSPLDFLGYIYASPGADRFDDERWRQPIASAMASLSRSPFEMRTVSLDSRTQHRAAFWPSTLRKHSSAAARVLGIGGDLLRSGGRAAGCAKA